MSRKQHHITFNDLMIHFQNHAKDKPIAFGCPELEFSRVKDRGDFIQIEFNQNVYETSPGHIVVDSVTE